MKHERTMIHGTVYEGLLQQVFLLRHRDQPDLAWRQKSFAKATERTAGDRFGKTLAMPPVNLTSSLLEKNGMT